MRIRSFANYKVHIKKNIKEMSCSYKVELWPSPFQPNNKKKDLYLQMVHKLMIKRKFQKNASTNRVYGESFFDDRLAAIDENMNSHKISNPNALHLISIAFLCFPSLFISPPCKHLQTPFQQKKKPL